MKSALITCWKSWPRFHQVAGSGSLLNGAVKLQVRWDVTWGIDGCTLLMGAPMTALRSTLNRPL
ncbi:MAG: hypothetical protein H6669_14900 [Ardenticatenaceae bacterium]|nr:hypothetical protein [Ardenticatenaceae bacterium]